MMNYCMVNYLLYLNRLLIFFLEEFLKEYPNAKIDDIADELKKDLIEEGCFSIQAGNDEWGCKTYVREK